MELTTLKAIETEEFFANNTKLVCLTHVDMSDNLGEIIFQMGKLINR